MLTMKVQERNVDGGKARLTGSGRHRIEEAVGFEGGKDLT